MIATEHGVRRRTNARDKPSYLGWTRQPNRRKRFPIAGRKSEITPLILLGVPHEHYANGCNIYTEDLTQTHPGSTGCFFLKAIR